MPRNWKESNKRFLNTMLGIPGVDRVPYCANIGEQMLTRISGMTLREILSNPKTYANVIMSTTQFLKSDSVYVPTSYGGPYEAVAFAETNNRTHAIKWYDYLPIFIKQGEICKNAEDVERLEIPDHNKIKIWQTTFETAKIISKTTKFPSMVGFGIWAVVQQLLGDNAFIFMRKEPALLLKLCEKIYQSQMEILKNWKENVGRIWFVFVTGYAFNGTMMSFDDAMKFEGQFIKKMQEEMKTPIVFHNCGMKPYFEEVCSEIEFLAIQGSHPLDINYWVSFKKKFPNVSIMGANIDVSLEMLTGTPQDVEAKVKENIENLALGGRYIVNPICNLPFNVPLPNIMAVPKAVKKYGIYPLS